MCSCTHWRRRGCHKVWILWWTNKNCIQTISHNRKIILGVFNTKLVRDVTFFPNVGQHSLHREENNDGIWLADFAVANNVIINGTLCSHKNTHKLTWRAPDEKTKNQIDHVLINTRHTKDVTDVRSYRRTDSSPDQFLVWIKFWPKISTCGIRSGKWIKRYGITKLNQTSAFFQYRDETKKLIEEKPVQ